MYIINKIENINFILFLKRPKNYQAKKVELQNCIVAWKDILKPNLLQRFEKIYKE